MKRVSHKTVNKYRKQGYDLGPKGKPDPVRVEAVRQAKEAIEREVERRANRFKAPPGSAKERLELAKAMRAELVVKREMGELVRVEDVQREAFRVARVTRDALLAIPDRLAALVAVETDQAKCHALMLGEITQALERLKESVYIKGDDNEQ